MNSVQKIGYHERTLRADHFRSEGFVYDSEFHFKGQPAGSVGIKQEPRTILIFNIEGFDLIPADQLVPEK